MGDGGGRGVEMDPWTRSMCETYADAMNRQPFGQCGGRGRGRGAPLPAGPRRGGGRTGS